MTRCKCVLAEYDCWTVDFSLGAQCHCTRGSLMDQPTPMQKCMGWPMKVHTWRSSNQRQFTGSSGVYSSHSSYCLQPREHVNVYTDCETSPVHVMTSERC